MKGNLFDDILIDSSALEEGMKLFNYSVKSAAADFYYHQFSNLGTSTKKTQPNLDRVPHEMKDAMDFCKKNLPDDAIIVELGGGKNQSRSGYPNYIFKNYIPLDISYTSIKAYVDAYDRFGIVADACKLPFKDSCLDVIFTHTFLEHPVQPENVLAEIDRVLKPGGFVIHSDAWNCRWWQHYGIVGIKKFWEMTLREKLIFCCAKFTEFKLFRQPIIILKRIFRILFGAKTNVVLKYKKLKPNYDLHLYVDEDAASSIDPIDVMRFYESRKYKMLPPLNFAKKIFFRNVNLYFKK